MPKVLYTGAVADLRGKLAGTSFTKGRSGSFFRSRVQPVSEATPAQTAWRSTFASLQQAWRELSNEQRLAWEQAVQYWPKKNVYGRRVYMTGINLFLLQNHNRFRIVNSLVTSPFPNRPPSTIPPCSVIFDVSANILAIIADNSNFENSLYVFMQVSYGKSAGVNNFTHKFYDTYAQNRDDTDRYFFSFSPESRYSTTTVGLKMQAKAYYCDADTGQLSQPTLFTGVAQ